MGDVGVGPMTHACPDCPCPIGYAESADWRQKRLKLIAEGRRFYATRTLIGGEPDVNRRHIYDHAKPCASPVEIWNADLKPWTAEDEKRLDARLAELNANPDAR